MSPPAEVVYLRSFGERDRHDHAVVAQVLDATAALVGEEPYAALTTRHIAERAGLNHREVCTYFRSKDAIVAEIYLGRLRQAPLSVDITRTVQERVVGLFEQLVLLLEHDPGLAAACSSALISAEPSVRAVRRRIQAELHRRVRTVLRSAAWPEVAEALEFGLVGAMVYTSCGSAGFRETADELAAVVAALLPHDS